MQAYKKRTKHTLCVIKPSVQLAKGGGACRNFAYYFMQLYNPGEMAQWPPPKYAPDLNSSIGYKLLNAMLFHFALCINCSGIQECLLLFKTPAMDLYYYADLSLIITVKHCLPISVTSFLYVQLIAKQFYVYGV